MTAPPRTPLRRVNDILADHVRCTVAVCLKTGVPCEVFPLTVAIALHLSMARKLATALRAVAPDDPMLKSWDDFIRP